MSRAFVKEPDGADAFEDLPDRPVDPHPNLVTARGLGLIEAEIEALRGRLAEAQAAADRATIATVSRDLRYWSARRATAELVRPPGDAEEARFGHRVTILRDDGKREVFRIVGLDEADPAAGLVSYVAPLARALLGRSVGDVVEAGRGPAEIVAIE